MCRMSIESWPQFQKGDARMKVKEMKEADDQWKETRRILQSRASDRERERTRERERERDEFCGNSFCIGEDIFGSFQCKAKKRTNCE